MRIYRYPIDVTPHGKSVTLVGLGNIGSPTATLLSKLSDVSFIRVIDPDAYEASNLVSQAISHADVGRPKAVALAHHIQQQSSGVAVEAIVSRVEDVPLGQLRADAMISCPDTRITRCAVNEAACRLQMPLLDSGVDAHALLARVNFYRPGHDQPCVECSWNNTDYDALEQVYACQSGTTASAPTRAPANLGSIAAGLLVTECQKLLAGDLDGPVAGYQVLLDCSHYRCLRTTYRPNPQCRFDHAAWQIDLLSESPQKLALGDFLQLAGSHQADLPPAVRVAGQSFVRLLVCPSCAAVRSECLYLTRSLTSSRLRCPSCHNQMVPSGFHTVDWLNVAALHRRHLRRSLSSIGLRAGDVVAIRTAEGCHYLEFPAPLFGGNARHRILASSPAIASSSPGTGIEPDGGEDHA